MIDMRKGSLEPLSMKPAQMQKLGKGHHHTQFFSHSFILFSCTGLLSQTIGTAFRLLSYFCKLDICYFFPIWYFKRDRTRVGAGKVE